MSSSLTINTENELIPNFKSKSISTKNKNRYASPDMKLLIKKYKENKILESLKEKRLEMAKEEKKDILFEESNDKFNSITTTTNFRTSNNFFNKISKMTYKNYNTESNLKTEKLKKKILKTENINDDNENFENNKKKKKFESNILDREKLLSNETFLKNHFLRYKQANSIYRILNKRTKNYIDSIKDYIHRQKKAETKIVLGLSPFPNISLNREFRFQDSTNKCVTIYDKSFGFPSIGERFERHMSELLRLKHVMDNVKENDKKKRDEYSYRMLSNYLAQNGIFDKEYYKEEYLYNFKEFLQINFEIHPDVPYKKFLYDVLFGYYDKYVSNPMDSNNSSLAYFERKNNKFNLSNFRTFNNSNINNNNKFNNTNNYFNKSNFKTHRKGSFSVNSTRRNSRSGLMSFKSTDDVPVDTIESEDDAKKFGKLLEYICLQKMKKKETLDNCFKKIENGEKLSV